MSVMNLLKDLATGNFSHAATRVQDWWSGVSPQIQHFLTEAESDEGKILEGLADVAVNDIATGGFSTASFVNAGKDVLAQLIAKNISTFTMQHVMAMLNIKVIPLVPAAQPAAQAAPAEVPAQ